MTTASAICCCGGCNVLGRGANSCTRCKPKYICAEVAVTPGPYNESECCDTFGFRLDFDGTKYVGQGACEAAEIILGLTVTLNDSPEGCETVVTDGVEGHEVTYPGTFPSADLPTIVYEVEDAAGNELTVTLTTAAMFINPLTVEPCSPCTCATCLPLNLCIEVVIPPRTAGYETICGRTVKQLAPWDCDSRSWIFDDYVFGEGDEEQTLSLSIQLMPASSGYCGIRVEGSLSMGSDPGGTAVLGYTSLFPDDPGVTFFLEGELDCRKIGGTECESWNTDIVMTMGEPATRDCESTPECEGKAECTDDPIPPIESQKFFSVVAIVGDFVQSDDTIVTELDLRGAECGTCELCQGCCASLPDTMYVTIEHPCLVGGEVTIAAHRSNSIPPCNPSGWRSDDDVMVSAKLCPVIPPFVDIVIEVEMILVIACGDNGEISVDILDPGGGYFFRAVFTNCTGGTVSESSPEVSVWNMPGACCDCGPAPGCPDAGSVSLSA